MAIQTTTAGAQASAPLVEALRRPTIDQRPNQMPMAQSLIKSAMSSAPVRHPMEGIGRLAQLVSGHYLKSQEDDRTSERNKAIEAHIQQSNPELAALYAMSDDDTRKAIAQSVVGDKFASARESRAQAREDEKYNRDVAREDALMDRNSAEARSLIDYRASANSRASAAEREQQLGRLRAAFPGASTQDLERYMLGVAPKTDVKGDYIVTVDPITGQATQQRLGGDQQASAQPTGKYFDSWETVPRSDEKFYEESVKAAVETSKKAHQEIVASNQQSSAALGRIDAMERAIEGGIGYSGAFADYVLDSKKVLVGMGLIDSEETSNAEVVKAMGTLLAPTAKQGLPGAVSNMEMKLFMEAVPGLMQTPEGIQKIIGTFRSFAERTRMRATIADEWRQYRAQQGKPALYAEGFEQFYRERASEIASQESRKVEALLRDAQPPRNRQEALQRQRGQRTPSGRPEPSADAINELKNNPGLAAQFDEFYGTPGRASRILRGLE